MTTIDIERAVKDPFKDSRWVEKTLLGLLWYILVVTAPALLGAHIQYIRRVASGERSLPAWTDFGDKWLAGLLVIVAAFVYSIPLIVLAVIVFVPVVVAAIAGEGEVAGVFAVAAALLYAAVAFVYGVALSIFFLAATTHYALKGGFGAFFEVGEIWRRIRHESSYWTAWLFAIALAIGASIVSAALGATVFGIILIPAVGYLQIMMTAHLLGQWAAKAYPPTGRSIPVGPEISA